MLGLVHTLLLRLCRDAQHSSSLQGTEEHSRQDTGPGCDGKNTKELDTNLLTTGGSSGKETVVLLGSQKTSGDNTPSTAEEVDWTGTQRIINLQLDEELAGVGVHNTSNKSNDEGRPWFSDVATGGDTDKSSQDSVEDRRQVGALSLNNFTKQGRDTTSGGGKSGGDGALGCGNHVTPSTSRAAVETIPAEPENEGSKALEGGGVSWDVDRLAVGSELSNTRSKEVGSHESGTTSSHVHNTATGKVKEAWSNVSVSQPALATPGPVYDNWVHEGREEAGVGSIGRKGATFGNSSTDNGGSSGSESPLEEPESVVGRARRLLEGGKEVLSSDKLVWRVSLDSKSETVPNGPPQDGTEASVQTILDKDVLGVLGADTSGFEQGKASLHKEHEATSEQEPKAVSDN